MLKRRRLPHLDVPGRAQFVTFRLAGSLPVNRTFSDVASGRAFLAMDSLLDQGRTGPLWLRMDEIAEVVHSCLMKSAAAGECDLHAYVIMPNHVHLLLTPEVGLPVLMRHLKGASARYANALLKRTGERFWQDESYDHLVRSPEEFDRIRRYIENNPVKASLVARIEDYQWSSAFVVGLKPSAG